MTLSQFVGRTFSKALTQASPEIAQQLLGAYTDSSLAYNAMLSSHLSSLSQNQDWGQLHHQLSVILKLPNIDLPIASQWAKTDLDAAMDWYLKRDPPNNEAVDAYQIDSAAQLLTHLFYSDHARAIDWLTSQQEEYPSAEKIMVRLAEGISYFPIGEFTLRLAALPKDAKYREQIVSVFIRHHMEKAKSNLEFPTNLDSLLETASLPDDAKLKWQKEITEARWMHEQNATAAKKN